MKGFFFLLLLLCVLFPATTLGYELFINSDPIGAKASIDEQEVGFTPLRLKSIEKKMFSLKLQKKDYLTVSKVVTMGVDRTTVVYMKLIPSKLNLVFQEKGYKLSVNGIIVGKTPIQVIGLPNGDYRLKKQDKTISLTTAAYRRTIRTNLIETGYMAGLLGVMLYGMDYFHHNGMVSHAKILGFGSAVSIGIIGYKLIELLKFEAGKSAEQEKLKEVKFEQYNRRDDRDYFTEGIENIGNGNYRDAISKFNFIINVFSTSHYMPLSMYELGYCYFQLHEYKKSIEYLRKFVYLYPIYELFSYGVYYLLAAEAERGKWEDAMIDYQKIRPIFIEDESGKLYQLYFDLLLSIYEKTGRIYKDIIDDNDRELQYFLTSYRNSPEYPKISFMRGKLQYLYGDKEKGKKILKKLKEMYRSDKKLVNSIESLLSHE